MSSAKRGLGDVRGVVFDLDGCVWTGEVLTPGAVDVLALLREQGRRVCFLTNNSRARSATLQAKLTRLGVQAATQEVLTPLEILGEVISTRWGTSRVLAIGGPELEQAVLDGGHALVAIERWKEAQVVVVGNDFGFSYERLTAAARAAACGAHFVTPNIDPRLPLELALVKVTRPQADLSRESLAHRVELLEARGPVIAAHPQPAAEAPVA